MRWVSGNHQEDEVLAVQTKIYLGLGEHALQAFQRDYFSMSHLQNRFTGQSSLLHDHDWTRVKGQPTSMGACAKREGDFIWRENASHPNIKRTDMQRQTNTFQACEILWAVRSPGPFPYLLLDHYLDDHGQQRQEYIQHQTCRDDPHSNQNSKKFASSAVLGRTLHLPSCLTLGAAAQAATTLSGCHHS